MECSICFRLYNDRDVVPISTICGHIFCKQCIEEVISTVLNTSCPTCSRKLTRADIHRVYLPDVNNNSQGDLLKSEIVITRVADLEISNERTGAQLKLVIDKLDQLSLNFSKIDGENATIMKENKDLKHEMTELKKLIRSEERALNFCDFDFVTTKRGSGTKSQTPKRL